MTTFPNHKTAKITEIILLSITLLLTLIPALLLLALLLETFRAELPDGQWERALQMIGFSVPGLFGFVSIIIRISNILSNKTSKVAALGLLTGTLLLILSFSPEFPQLFRRQDFILLAAIFFPCRPRLSACGISTGNCNKKSTYKSIDLTSIAKPGQRQHTNSHRRAIDDTFTIYLL